MAIEKSLYAAPMGLDALAAQDEEMPGIEIEIEDPEAVEIGIDGQPIMRIEKGTDEEDFNANLADEMSDRELETLASELVGQYEEDVASRKDWMQTYVDGLELLVCTTPCCLKHWLSSSLRP